MAKKWKMVKVIYEVKDGDEVKRKVDYIPVGDLCYAYEIFMANHGLSKPDVLGLFRIE